MTAADAQAAVSTARWYSQAARELQEADGWHDTLQRIVELADKIAGADLVALIGLPRPGASPALLAATDYTTAEELVALQRAAGAAPAWHAILQRCTVQVDDLAADDRWPAYGQQLVSALSFRTVLAFCLLIDDQPLASLALYTQQPAGFTPDQIELAAAFADHAAIAFNQAAQVEKITNLELALQPRPGHRRSPGHHHDQTKNHPGSSLRPTSGEPARTATGSCTTWPWKLCRPVKSPPETEPRLFRVLPVGYICDR